MKNFLIVLLVLPRVLVAMPQEKPKIFEGIEHQPGKLEIEPGKLAEASSRYVKHWCGTIQQRHVICEGDQDESREMYRLKYFYFGGRSKPVFEPQSGSTALLFISPVKDDEKEWEYLRIYINPDKSEKSGPFRKVADGSAGKIGKNGKGMDSASNFNIFWGKYERWGIKEKKFYFSIGFQNRHKRWGSNEVEQFRRKLLTIRNKLDDFLEVWERTYDLSKLEWTLSGGNQNTSFLLKVVEQKDNSRP